MNSTNLVHEFWSEIASPNANRNNVGQKLSSGATKRARANLLGKFLDIIQSIVDLLNMKVYEVRAEEFKIQKVYHPSSGPHVFQHNLRRFDHAFYDKYAIHLVQFH